MAKMTTLEIATYISDIGDNEFTQMPVKIRDGFQNDAGAVYQAKTKSLCGLFAGFSPRRLIATFHTQANSPKYGARIIYPVPRTEDIEPMVLALKNNGAVCIDLEGEEWRFVPPAIGQYEPGSGSFTLEIGTTSPKTSGTIEGTSDISGPDTQFNVRWETDPTALSQAIAECAGPFVDKAACFGTAIKARKLLAYSKNQAGGSIVRSGPVPSKGDIIDCIDSYMGVAGVHCVGYKGESVKRVDLLIATP